MDFGLLCVTFPPARSSHSFQVHAGGAYLEECDANRQSSNRGVAIQPTSLYGSEEPAGRGGQGECAQGCQESSQAV